MLDTAFQNEDGQFVLLSTAMTTLLYGHILQCDVTAVGATVCRHYVIAHLLDISTGERYIYACVMLYVLMVSSTVRLSLLVKDRPVRGTTPPGRECLSFCLQGSRHLTALPLHPSLPFEPWPAALTFVVQVTYGIPIMVVWYDINCKFGGFFARWAQQFVRFAGLLRALQTRFPLPCFHKYCHRCLDGQLEPLQLRGLV